MKKGILTVAMLIAAMSIKAQKLQVEFEFEGKYVGEYSQTQLESGYVSKNIHITEPVSLQEYKAIKKQYSSMTVTCAPSVRQLLWNERTQRYDKVIDAREEMYNNAPAAFHVQKSAQYYQSSVFAGIATALITAILYNPEHQGYINNANEIAAVGLIGSFTTLGLYVAGNYELQMASSKGMWNN